MIWKGAFHKQFVDQGLWNTTVDQLVYAYIYQTT